jgi:hypothetical protein
MLFWKYKIFAWIVMVDGQLISVNIVESPGLLRGPGPAGHERWA